MPKSKSSARATKSSKTARQHTAAKAAKKTKHTERSRARRTTPLSDAISSAASAQENTAPVLAPPPHFIVFIPGFLGSKLRDRTTGKIVWLDFGSVPLNPLEWEGWLNELFEKMHYPNPNLEPAGLIDDVMFVPPWIKQEQYSRMLKMLESWGYRVDPLKHTDKELNVYTFAYDWRQDNRISARQLKDQIDVWRALHPGEQVWLIGHSNGGILSRWYIEKEGGKDIVSRLFLLASPWDGSPSAVYMLFHGLDTLFRVRFNLFDIPERTRQALRSFPAMYHLIPQAHEFLRGPNNQVIDPFTGQAWLDDPQQIALLEDGRRFNQELGNHLSVETVSFVGRKLETRAGGRVHMGNNARWDGIEWFESQIGDGTLPEYTAFYPDARVNMPVIAEHGDIYVNPALMDMLRLELIDKYTKMQAGVLEDNKPQTDAVTVLDRPTYSPGDRVNVQINVRKVKDGTSIRRAILKARVNWLQGLPGSTEVMAPSELPAIVLNENPDVPGQYEGHLMAPAQEGYYQLETQMRIPLQDEMTLHDIFVVEQGVA